MSSINSVLLISGLSFGISSNAMFLWLAYVSDNSLVNVRSNDLSSLSINNEKLKYIETSKAMTLKIVT